MMSWNELGRPDLGFADLWSRQLGALQRRAPDQFPDLGSATTLVVASDFSGCHKASAYEVATFLLASLDGSSGWESKRRVLRQQLLPQQRRMSFKNLNDRHRRNALASFLDAANDIPGVVVSFCVNRRVKIPLCADEETDRADDEVAPTALFATLAFRRLIRLSSFVGLFLAGLSAPSQNVLWFVDEDDFVADTKRICAATTVVGRVLSAFLPHSLGHLRFGSARSDDGSRSVEDLVAVADLAGGALAEILTLCGHEGAPRSLSDIPRGLSVKTRYILSWVANTAPPLKKLTCVISSGDDASSIRSQWIQVHRYPALVQPAGSSPATYIGSLFGRQP